MSKTVGIRELSRNIDILNGHDYVDIEDKRTHKYRGLLISPQFAEEIKNYIEKKKSQQKQKNLDDLMQFAGTVDGETGNLTFQQMKASKKLKYYNE